MKKLPYRHFYFAMLITLLSEGMTHSKAIQTILIYDQLYKLCQDS